MHFLTKQRKTILALSALFVLTLIFMLPRFLSAQFGLLDDGYILTIAEDLSNRPMDSFNFRQSSGRFTPSYWLSLSLILRFTGMSPLGGFLGTWVWLLGAVWGIYAYMRWRGTSNLQALLAGALYCLSAPSVENYYTFSKSEPILLFWILIGLFFISRGIKNQHNALRAFLLLSATWIC